MAVWRNEEFLFGWRNENTGGWHRAHYEMTVASFKATHSFLKQNL